MNTRRGFFSRLAAVVAAVAIAPEIAFRTRLALPEVERQVLVYACNQNGVYEQLLKCGSLAECETVKDSKVDLEELFRTVYEIKKARQKAGLSEEYILAISSNHA